MVSHSSICVAVLKGAAAGEDVLIRNFQRLKNSFLTRRSNCCTMSGRWTGVHCVSPEGEHGLSAAV